MESTAGAAVRARAEAAGSQTRVEVAYYGPALECGGIQVEQTSSQKSR